MIAAGCSVETLGAAVMSEQVADQAKVAIQQEALLEQRAAVRDRVRKHRIQKAEQNQQTCNSYIALQPVTQSASIREGRIVSKEVSKKEEKEDSRRVLRKRSQIPTDLACSEKNVADANKIGVLEADIVIEWSKFHDHHLHKGTLGVNWDAGWRRWCHNSILWKKPEGNSNGRQNGTRGNVLPAIEKHLADFRASKAKFDALDGQGEPRVRDGTFPFTLRLLPKG